jgi:hypothetical protein
MRMRVHVCVFFCKCAGAAAKHVPTNPVRAPAPTPLPQVSLLRTPLPDNTRRCVLVAITRMLPCAEARRALVTAGTEAAVQAVLDGGQARHDEPDDAATRLELYADWLQVQTAAFEVLAAILRPPPADARPAPAADAPQCAACGKSAADVPGGGPLMRCGSCRGPERWCSQECQRASWAEGHREVCRQRQAATAAAAGPAAPAAAAPSGAWCVIA